MEIVVVLLLLVAAFVLGSAVLGRMRRSRRAYTPLYSKLGQAYPQRRATLPNDGGMLGGLQSQAAGRRQATLLNHPPTMLSPLTHSNLVSPFHRNNPASSNSVLNPNHPANAQQIWRRSLNNPANINSPLNPNHPANAHNMWRRSLANPANINSPLNPNNPSNVNSPMNPINHMHHVQQMHRMHHMGR